MSNVSIAKGSCLCGAVSLSTTSMSKNVGACHFQFAIRNELR
jgi:hypothetical protein